MNTKIRVLIVGGCFPVQDNIPFPKLYHQLLKDMVSSENGIELILNIIRYDKLEDCFKLINDVVSKDKPDCILFHLRVEPLFKYIKFYYRYHNRKNILVSSLNISFAGIHNLILHRDQVKTNATRNSISNRKKSKAYYFLQESNYFLGLLLGNLRYSLNLYLNLLIELKLFCSAENIKLFITGPASRPVSFFENYISDKLYKYFKAQNATRTEIIVNGSGINDNYGNFLFCEDKIRVNEAGHKRFANLLYEPLINYLEK